MRIIKALFFILVFIQSGLIYGQLKIVPINKNSASKATQFSPNSRLTAETLTLPIWEDFSTYLGKPDTSLWINSQNVWVNTGFGINPPSLHVASFDGLDQNGAPYSLDPADIGETDSLVSKPIDLTLVALNKRNTVYLSFYYQKGGDGEPPDPQDKIELQVKTASAGWVTAWPADPDVLNRFTTIFSGVCIKIADSLFHDSFQFRFVATGRRSGMLDVWNLDYIYLDKNRSTDDFEILDRAITTRPNSIFKNYSAIPVRQLLLKDQEIMDSTKVEILNLEVSEPVQGIEYSTLITNAQTSSEIEKLVDKRALIIQAEENLSLEADKATLQLIKDQVNGPDDSLFLKLTYFVDTGDTLLIDEIDPFTNDTTYIETIDLRVNDTVSRNFTLHNYFAYDDGTAEFGAGVNQIDGQIAYKYFLDEPDTIVGFSMHFPNTVSAVSGLPLEIIILKDTEGILSSTLLVEPITIQSNGIDEFKYYPLLQPLAVRDTIYIGFKQATNEFVAIGLDANTDSGDNIYFNVNGEWQKNTDVKGSLMLRPVFGKGGLITSVDNESNLTENITIYPNPNNGNFRITPIPDNVNIFDLMGREIYFNSITDASGLSINPYNIIPGLYLVAIQVKNQRIVQKLVIR